MKAYISTNCEVRQLVEGPGLGMANNPLPDLMVLRQMVQDKYGKQAPLFCAIVYDSHAKAKQRANYMRKQADLLGDHPVYIAYRGCTAIICRIEDDDYE